MSAIEIYSGHVGPEAFAYTESICKLVGRLAAIENQEVAIKALHVFQAVSIHGMAATNVIEGCTFYAGEVANEVSEDPVDL